MKRAVLSILITCVSLTLAFGARAEKYEFPKDYTIDEATFSDFTTEEAVLKGTWLKSEDKTSYTVTLYKGSTKVFGKRVGKEEVDFSDALVSKKGGAGNYVFTVYPTKGGEELMITSETLEVTTTMISAVKNRIAKEKKAAIAARGGGWEKGPGNNLWIYYDQTGTQVKGKWIEYNGHKYYLDKSGIMLTGWQAINSVYYYLEPKGSNGYPIGACWVDTVTPDGYTVDADGARLDTSGNPEEVKVSKVLSSIAISLKEDQDPGTYTKIREIACGSGTLSDITYQSDPATWTSEVVGKVTFKGRITNGYTIGESTKISCSRASGVSMLSHTRDTFSAELRYVPKYVLEEPADFYIDENWTLHWGKVTKAQNYTVKITVGYQEEKESEDGEITMVDKTKTVSVTTESPQLDLTASEIDSETDVKSITVSAAGPDTKHYISSAAAKIDDFKTFVETKMLPGTFITDSKGLKYEDEYGEEAIGWKEILGDWYYFKSSGYAKTGWFKDESGYWYYFGKNWKMQTGEVTLSDGVTYCLNDGSNPDLPLGAWVQ